MKTSGLLICLIVLLTFAGCKISKNITINEVPEYKDIECLILRTPDGKFYLSSYEFKDDYLEGVLVQVRQSFLSIVLEVRAVRWLFLFT